MKLRMVKYVRPLHGGSSPHLMYSEKGDLYVVKLLGNPQGNRVLANELLAGRLGVLAGLPVPELREAILDEHIAEEIQALPDGLVVSRVGPHLASKYPVSVFHGRVYDGVPRGAILGSPGDVVGAAAFDAWTGNIDERQFVCWRRSCEKKYHVLLIDNGFCFGGIDWNLNGRSVDPIWRLASLRESKFLAATVDMLSVNQMLAGWVAAISRIRSSDIRAALSDVPDEWNACASDLKTLAELLIARKELLGRYKVVKNETRFEAQSFDNKLLSRYHQGPWRSYRCVGRSRPV